ncbi:MAG: 50S ribosomal protein L9 [Armatimonadota bacterium]|nr:50S ribosomal protein L9 [bacterium]MCS7308753.1 50S ribosomal protein L9 [Armatimonadota bacterium]MDW8103507.1 50S ribosomal protein L9 [Armatimonadota bacterium]MDW8289299.1 50S ribosomal protein L9 [Armatimonadota bacterium]
MATKVILTRDVPSLGKHGEVVNVSEGYARNYLFPRGLAIPADKGAMKNVQLQQKRVAMRAEKEAQEAQQTAEVLRGKTVTVRAHAGKGTTKLFGAVTAQHIAEAIAQQYHVKVDKRKIGLLEPIKSLGEYEVTLHLHHDVNVTLRVEVVPQETSA